ncbi:MAG TPA: Ku protein [Mycobacteriales bacterium]|nr:Ku protein [Mycobacteriales bacterium]
MRSIWKGSISFGLVTIPVKLYSATEQKDVSFHQVRRSDGSRIKYKRVAQADGEEVQYADIAKGYELDSGETVVLTDEDFKDLPLRTNRAIDVLQFVPMEQVDPILFEKSYYLEPDKAGAKPYVLLRDALAESGKVAVVKVALRNRESLATLRVREGVFVLETMMWPDEVRTPDFAFLDEDIEVRAQELAMAGSLIDTLSGDFTPEEYADGYRAALQAVIDAKVEGREVVQPEDAQPTAGTVVDLMAALRASVDAAKARAAGGSQEAAATAKKPPAKKSAPPKSTTPTSTAKKAPAAKSLAAKKVAAAPQRGAAKKAAAPAKRTAAAKKSATPKQASTGVRRSA